MRAIASKTVLALSVSLALLTACDRGAQAPPASTTADASAAVATATAAAWDSAISAFIDGYFQRNPAQAANAGKHEYDGKLPDWSAAGLQSNIQWLHQQRDAMSAFADDKLDATQKFQRDYAVAVIDGQLFWLEESGFTSTNPGFYAGDLSPSMYLTRPYAPLEQRMAAFVTYEEALPAAIAQVRANMKSTLPATYIDLGANTFGGYASFFKEDVPAAFATVKDDALQARFAIANAAAIKASQELADWFKSLKP